MEDGFEVVCQQVVVFLPLFGDNPLYGSAKRIRISFCASTDELSQQFTVRHTPYALFILHLARGTRQTGYYRRIPTCLRNV